MPIVLKSNENVIYLIVTFVILGDIEELFVAKKMLHNEFQLSFRSIINQSLSINSISISIINQWCLCYTFQS